MRRFTVLIAFLFVSHSAASQAIITAEYHGITPWLPNARDFLRTKVYEINPTSQLVINLQTNESDSDKLNIIKLSQRLNHTAIPLMKKLLSGERIPSAKTRN